MIDREQAIQAVSKKLVDGPTSLTDADLAEEIVDAIMPVVTDEMVERATLSWWNGERAGYDLPPQTLELASRDGAWEQYEARMEAALLAALDGER